MRGNRTIKVSASELDAFHSPNMLPLAKMGINIDVDYRAIHRYQTILKYDFNTFNVILVALWNSKGVVQKRRRNFLAVFDTPLPHVKILTLIYLTSTYS